MLSHTGSSLGIGEIAVRVLGTKLFCKAKDIESELYVKLANMVLEC